MMTQDQILGARRRANWIGLHKMTITILNHAEFGQTLSRAGGMFDMAVNGGGLLTVNYQKDGYLPLQRPMDVLVRDYSMVHDVCLIAFDPNVTTIDLTAGVPIQVARGGVVTDSSGTRQATLFFKLGTTATMTLPAGGTQPLTTLHVRATEYTVGPMGTMAMPGDLPPTSAYTYASEYSVDKESPPMRPISTSISRWFNTTKTFSTSQSAPLFRQARTTKRPACGCHRPAGS